MTSDKEEIMKLAAEAVEKEYPEAAFPLVGVDLGRKIQNLFENKLIEITEQKTRQEVFDVLYNKGCDISIAFLLDKWNMKVKDFRGCEKPMKLKPKKDVKEWDGKTE